MNKAFSILAVICICPWLGGCANNASKAAGWSQQAMLVKVMTAKSEPMTDSSTYVGTAKSRHSVSLSPQIEGQVTKLFVQSGQPVKKGTVLLEISPEKQQASVNSYKFASWSSEKDLTNAKEQLRALESQKAAKQSNLKLAQNNRDRYASLSESGAVARMDFDQKVNTYESAKAELDTVDAQINAQKASIERMSQQVHQTGESLKEQQVQLQYYTIKAPFDGVVGEIPVKLGNFVNTATVLTTVTQNKPLEIYVEVPVERANDVKQGMDVVLLDQRDQRIGSGKVSFIAPNVSPDSQTVLVKAQYDNERGNLRADQLIKATVVWTKHDGVMAPTEAVCHQGGEDFVFLLQNGKKGESAHEVSVKLGDIQNSRYQVLAGVKPGDRMIVSGVQNLTDGAPVTVSQ